MIHPCHAANLGHWDQVSCYCERAMSPDFWAEPLNALSNMGFIVAAVMVYADLRASRVEPGRQTILALTLLLMTVGAGSLLFHTFATVWSRFADIVPIAVFVAVYMALSLSWFLEFGLVTSAGISLIVVGITVTMFLFGSALNGSLAYAPALLSLVAISVILHQRKSGATDWVLSATCVFTASLFFRTIDGWPTTEPLGCMVRDIGERTMALGTHSLWHILNAVTLYLLLRAAIENPPRPRRT